MPHEIADRVAPQRSPDERDFRRSAFGPTTRPIVRAVAEALFTDPERPESMSSERLDWVVAEADDFAGHASKQLGTGLLLALLLLEWLPLLVVGRFSRASSLSVGDRIGYIAKLEGHAIPIFALLVVAWKTMLTFVWFEHPENASALGYDGRHERHLLIKPGVRAPHPHVPFRQLRGGSIEPTKKATLSNAGSFLGPS